MRDRIRLLPESIANQIAAGEVVNRPSSVVKELLENAIDAGSGSVTVNIRDGGKGLIQIVDDGCGMSDIDARMAFDRHATSKIVDVEDIYRLQTFGFRGEALASIASVAEVELRTRLRETELGTRVIIHGGRFVEQEAVNCPEGTQLLIKNLFYNVPARRRFLEKSSTETRHIVTEFQRVALCYPDKSFSLYDSDALISKLLPANLKQRIVDVVGKSMAANLLEVSAETSIVNIHGFVGRPEAAKKTNREQFLFVNGRFFKSAYFNKAVASAYDKLIAPGTQPSYFLYLTVDPERIDVNVHPQKTEVKFSDGVNMWQIINAAVRESLAKSGAVPAMDFEMDTSIEIPVMRETNIRYREPGITANPDFNPFERYGGSGSGSDDFAAEASAGMPGRAWAKEEARDFSLAEETFAEEDYESSVLEFIEGDEASQPQLDIACMPDAGGEVLRIDSRYVATACGDGMRIVDTLRACEALLYGRYLAMLDSGGSATQQLLFPEAMELSPDDASLMGENLDSLAALGFDISLTDARAEIAGIPADIDAGVAREVIAEMLDGLREGEADPSQMKRRRLAAGLARAASAGRVKTMLPEEAQALLAQLDAAGAGYTPSGLKVSVLLSRDRIRKLFD